MNGDDGPKTNRNQIILIHFNPFWSILILSNPKKLYKIGNFITDFTLFVANGDNGPKTNGNQTSNCTNAKNGAKKEESDLHQDAVELKPLTDQGEIAKAVQEPKPKPPPPSTISVNESR